MEKILLNYVALPVTAGLLLFGCATNPETPTQETETETSEEGKVMEVGDSTATGEVSTTGNLITVVQSQPNLSTLVKAIEAANLTTMLQGPGTYTIFAPTNDAFSALPAGELDNLLRPENKAELVQLLQYHVVPSVVVASDLKSVHNIKTVQGGRAKISTEGNDILLDEAKVITPDITASNGVIHVVDKVLLPPAETGN